MAYPLAESHRSGDESYIEHPDPALMTKEAREDLIRRIIAIKEEILTRRGGIPIDVDELLAELREERGTYRS
jgi:hypothetical protein